MGLTCRTGKLAYFSRRVAEIQLRHIRRRRRHWRSEKVEVATYHCQFCNWWHLTSQQQLVRG